jgi:pyrophosphatase PpaX
MKILHKYKTFLLDWDGCLAKTLDVWLCNYSKLYKEYGVEATDSEIIAKSWGNWEKGPESFGIKESKKFIQKLVSNIEHDLSEVELYSGAKELIKNINNSGGQTAIVTSSKRELVYPAIKHYKIEKYIDCFLSSEDVKNLKPDPEIIDKALNCLNSDKSTAIIIGDTPKDVKAGLNAGIDTLLFFPKENEKFYDKKEMENCKATYKATKIKEIK